MSALVSFIFSLLFCSVSSEARAVEHTAISTSTKSHCSIRNMYGVFAVQRTNLHTMYMAAMLNVDPPSKIQGYTAGVDDPAPPTNHGSGILAGPWMTQRTGVVGRGCGSSWMAQGVIPDAAVSSRRYAGSQRYRPTFGAISIAFALHVRSKSTLRGACLSAWIQWNTGIVYHLRTCELFVTCSVRKLRTYMGRRAPERSRPNPDLKGSHSRLGKETPSLQPALSTRILACICHGDVDAGLCPVFCVSGPHGALLETKRDLTSGAPVYPPFKLACKPSRSCHINGCTIASVLLGSSTDLRYASPDRENPSVNEIVCLIMKKGKEEISWILQHDIQYKSLPRKIPYITFILIKGSIINMVRFLGTIFYFRAFH